MTGETAFLTALTGAISVLGGVVAFLWRQISAAQLKTEAKLEACEKTHAETQEMMLGMVRELGELRGKQDGISEMAGQVLKTVAELTKTQETE